MLLPSLKFINVLVFTNSFYLLSQQRNLTKLEPKDFQDNSNPVSYISNLLKKAALQHLEDPKYCHQSVKDCVKHLSDLEQYMLGATALDCSLMVAFCRISHEDVYR